MTTHEFPHTWQAEILKAPPLIAPARQYTYPQQIAGEEDALARGALQLLIPPVTGGQFLATCSLGSPHPPMPTDTHPFSAHNLPPSPVRQQHPHKPPVKSTQKANVSIHPAPTNNLLLFTGFHIIFAWGPDGEAWHTQRLSWEGIHITGIEGHTLHGTGWNMRTDMESLFTVDLRTGQHQGGGFS
jgi:hypothetical protein